MMQERVAVLKMAKERALHPEIFASDGRLKAFLALWHQHRSTEIFEMGLFNPGQIAGEEQVLVDYASGEVRGE